MAERISMRIRGRTYEKTIEYLGPAIERNNEKWGYAFRKE